LETQGLKSNAVAVKRDRKAFQQKITKAGKRKNTELLADFEKNYAAIVHML
jgi:hypothetical protein